MSCLFSFQLLLCYDHRMTDCSEHQETELSAARAKILLSKLNEVCTSSDSGSEVAAECWKKCRLGSTKQQGKKTVKSEQKNSRKRMRDERKWHRVKSEKAHEMEHK